MFKIDLKSLNRPLVLSNQQLFPKTLLFACNIQYE